MGYTLKKKLLTYGLPVITAVVMASFTGGDHSKYYLCKHEYALCTSARCVPIPNEPGKAICFCDVEEGPSTASMPCDALSPSTNSFGVRTVYSTYSFRQFYQGRRIMTCPSGMPWTNCLNKRCTVDPTNPKKAICVCDIVRKEEYVTLGGGCDTSTCATGYWSGATLELFETGTAFMKKTTGVTEVPIQWCPK